jgi:hypothetical protein
MQVLGGLVREPIIPSEPPRRDEPSKTTPQKGASFWFRAVIYENRFTPLPEMIPALLRRRTPKVHRNTQNISTRQPMTGSAMIQREIPSSYSEQVSQ